MPQRLSQAADVAVIGGGPAGCAAALTLGAIGDCGRPARCRAGAARGRRDLATVGPPRARRPGPACNGRDRRPPSLDRKLVGMGRRGTLGARLHLQPLRPRLASRPPPLRCAAACDARAPPGAQPATATVVASDALPSGGFRLHLSGGRQMTARIVLDATGRNASFARQRGVKRRAIDRMIALVGLCARVAPMPRRSRPRRWSKPCRRDGGTRPRCRRTASSPSS